MVSGAVFGGLIATGGLFSHLIESVFGISGNWTLLFGGVVLIVTVIQNPDGVAGSTYRKQQLKAKRAAATGAAGGVAVAVAVQSVEPA